MTRTDPDNIAFAQKFVFDGLQESGVLRGDGWKDIRSIRHEFGVSEVGRVGVEVTLEWRMNE